MYFEVGEKVKNSNFSENLYSARKKKTLFEIFYFSNVKMFSSGF